MLVCFLSDFPQSDLLVGSLNSTSFFGSGGRTLMYPEKPEDEIDEFCVDFAGTLILTVDKCEWRLGIETSELSS